MTSNRFQHTKGFIHILYILLIMIRKSRHVLKRVDSADYLGVKLDSKLNLNVHIGSLCKKATSTRQFLQRTLAACVSKTKAQMYNMHYLYSPDCGICCHSLGPSQL